LPPPCPAHAHLRCVPTAKACWEPRPWFRSGMLALCVAGERSDLDTLRHMSDMCTLSEQPHDQEVLYHVTVLVFALPFSAKVCSICSSSTIRHEAQNWGGSPQQSRPGSTPYQVFKRSARPARRVFCCPNLKGLSMSDFEAASGRGVFLHRL
jgi:hypothetical protein